MGRDICLCVETFREWNKPGLFQPGDSKWNHLDGTIESNEQRNAPWQFRANHSCNWEIGRSYPIFNGLSKIGVRPRYGSRDWPDDVSYVSCTHIEPNDIMPGWATIEEIKQVNWLDDSFTTPANTEYIEEAINYFSEVIEKIKIVAGKKGITNHNHIRLIWAFDQ